MFRSLLQVLGVVISIAGAGALVGSIIVGLFGFGFSRSAFFFITS
jgi:hypothetical protein